MSQTPLRAIPSVDRVLRELGETDVPRAAVVALVRRELGTLPPGRAESASAAKSLATLSGLCDHSLH